MEPYKPLWLIRKDQPFRGFATSYTTPNGTVAYSGGLTVEEYIAESQDPIEVLTDEQFTDKLNAYHQSLITRPEEITEERWFDLLECLPPARWHRHRGVEMFHMSERITDNIVQWCAKLNGKFYGWQDRDDEESETLAAKVVNAAYKVPV
ncbi:MAG: hypothetical protein NXI16_01460 [Alphaproteobacteria bacterium]|nr:hypothetical protein [Alphaproteobacteria bacterium]